MQKSSLTEVHYITIDPDFENQRIDNFLVTKLKGLPKTRIYRILRKGEVRVNKKRVQPSYRLKAGDQVRIPPMHLEEREAPEAPSRSLMTVLSERILFEDKNLFILNKPHGIPVHGGSKVKIGIVEALRCMYPKLPHLELAHRLDADTSGCLVLAKKRSVLKELHELFRSGKMHKVYLALTMGHWDPSEYRVDVSLQKNHLSSGERIVRVNPEGKTALTVFKPLETFTDATLVEATLHTGRTHQIRVHAQYRGHPISADEKYGDREFNKHMRQLGSKRMFLHSSLIEFDLPSTGQAIRIAAPLDDELTNCLEKLRANEQAT
ncbi:MAG: 23S rRNA pseudouridine(955/2504/2580) synthase RluC [Gammaproteobacteria bacterium]